uniref:hypothetical protein n=1 Tax=Arcanobacterium phocae TaxID=131112 RepID=UPI001C0ECCC6
FITALGGDGLVDRMNLTQQFYHVPSYPVVDHPQSRYAIVLKKVFTSAQPHLSPAQSVGLARQMAQHLSTTHTTAISWLLYDATLTSEFLTEFGDQLERYEHTHTTTTTTTLVLVVLIGCGLNLPQRVLRFYSLPGYVMRGMTLLRLL